MSIRYVSIDTETCLIGIDAIIPDLICTSVKVLGKEGESVLHWLEHKEETLSLLKDLFSDPEAHIIFHNASFDLTVFAKYDWSLMPLIWQAAEQGRIHDTMIREMLINLTSSGSIDIIEQYGIKSNVSYSLASLVKQYLQIDLSKEKEAEDSVRVNYESVRYKALADWPKEFIDYAKKDADYTASVFLEQERRRGEVKQAVGHDPFKKEGFVVCTALALQFMTAQGNKLDTEKVKEVTKEFIDQYNDPEMTWPLIHSAYIQSQALKTGLKGRELIEACKVAFQYEDASKWLDTGIIIPAKPAEPYASGAKDHVEGCKDKKNCSCPHKMKAPQPEKGSDNNLDAYVWEAARRNESIELWVSDLQKERLKKEGVDIPHPLPRELILENQQIPMVTLGDKQVKLSLRLDKEWMETFASLDPVLSVYYERNKIQKIVTSYLPSLYWADGYKTACPLILPDCQDKLEGKQPASRVHACFSPLKETGRTSSYANKRGTGNKATVTFPSWNGQQVDPRIRNCVIAEPGNVICSIDYSAMELGTAAQIAYNLLGYEGVLMKLINDGKDTHSYLGAQIAVAIDPEFTGAWGLSSDDPLKSYTLFKEASKDKTICDSPVFRRIFDSCYVGKKWGDHVVDMSDCTMSAFYKHFRTFGKPTGLGFWGGLGEPTFISLAKATYGIEIDMDTAKMLRNLWRTYIPEGQAYLDYVNKYMVDGNAAPDLVEDDYGRVKKRHWYAYTTPMGGYRPHCSYTAAANGCALQSPSAEGALTAVIEVMKQCTVGELAGYVFPSLFIHDELIQEMVYDDHTTERVEKIQKIMKDSMEKITPNVRAGTEACLMRRWDKKAEPVFKDGKLIPWEDKD